MPFKDNTMESIHHSCATIEISIAALNAKFDSLSEQFSALSDVVTEMACTKNNTGNGAY